MSKRISLLWQNRSFGRVPAAGAAVLTAAAGTIHLAVAASQRYWWFFMLAGVLQMVLAGGLVVRPASAVWPVIGVNSALVGLYLTVHVAIPGAGSESASTDRSGLAAGALELGSAALALTVLRRNGAARPLGTRRTREDAPRAPWVSRRQLLGAGSLGAASAVSAGVLGRVAVAGESHHGPRDPASGGHAVGAGNEVRDRIRAAHLAGLQPVGEVDHARNGFDPHAILTDFDAGEVSTDSRGRTVREYEFAVINKDIEVAPGVFFPAWTYNGRVPGPTVRATEGDRIRIRFANTSDMPHTIHFHGIHPAKMDGVPGAGEVFPGETFIYDFIAEPFGTHLYHCHSLPLKDHIHRGLYGAFIVDPKQGRPPANEMVMVMNAFDTNFDGENEIYAVNTVAFAYAARPITINRGELQRVHLINITEFDPINSLHLHANFFHLYRTGTSLEPNEFLDTISMGQAERHMLEFSYKFAGRFMFHAHQTEFVELGWMGHLDVV
jgi:FtsP/CotA-like multicopper oxidase with cupredoxin domain